MNHDPPAVHPPPAHSIRQPADGVEQRYPPRDDPKQTKLEVGPGGLQQWDPGKTLEMVHGSLISSVTSVGERSPMCCSPAEPADRLDTRMDKGELHSSPTGEDSDTPNYLRWARDLRSLLQDSEGVQLFRQYLSQEGCNDCLDFWFACEGLKKWNSGTRDIVQAIKMIFKTYIRSGKVEISKTTSDAISEKISARLNLEPNIFDQAQQEFENLLMRTTYSKFIQSDLYIQHVEMMKPGAASNESPRQSEGSGPSSTDSSSSVPSRQGMEILPTLHEDAEFSDDVRGNALLPTLTRDNVRQRYKFSDLMPRLRPDTSMYAGGRVPNPYHVRNSYYVPPSAQDSELHSLSSDAHTDDTMSMTDSSIDCGPVFPDKRQHRKQQRAIRKNASLNRDSLDEHTIIPRTHIKNPANLAEKDPDKFATDLIEKLRVVKKKSDCSERMKEFQKNQMEEMKPMITSYETTRHPVNHPASFTDVIREKFGFNDESDQAILDKHVSRVFDTPHLTPSRSPRSHSPAAAVDRRRSAPLPCPPHYGTIPGRNPVTSSNVPLHPNKLSPYSVVHHTTSRHKKERDTYSSDSGAVHDFAPENEPNFHLIHPHKHNRCTSSSGCVSSKVSAMGPPEPPEHIRSSRDASRKSTGKKQTAPPSADSGVDSGVSVVYEPLPLNQAATERVYNWMLDNEKYSYPHGPDSEKDSSTRHKKSSHSSVSASSSAQSRSKHAALSLPRKSGTLSGASRSASQERGNSWSSTLPSGSHSLGIQPSQPFAQDPSMPILPQPDTTTQLVEAKRRLEEDSRLKMTKANRKSSKRSTSSSVLPPTSTSGSSGSAATAPAPDVTIIGYCYSGESVPYLTKLAGKNITLKQFKQLLSKKGNFRYFFKRASEEFGTGVVNEEISDENEVLPLWEGKIYATVMPMD